jgi:hypothetical protein
VFDLENNFVSLDDKYFNSLFANISLAIKAIIKPFLSLIGKVIRL